MPKESSLVAYVMQLAKERQWYARKMSPPVAAGTPDILLCTERGLFVAIECKTGSKVTRLQQHNLDTISSLGGIACVVRSRQQAREVFSRIESEVASRSQTGQ